MTRFVPRFAAPALLALTLALPIGAASAQTQPAPMASGARALQSADLEGTASWYRDNLGFRVISDRSTVRGRLLVLERRGVLVEVAEAEAEAERKLGQDDVETTASVAGPAVTLLVSDVDAQVDTLRGRNVVVIDEPHDDFDGRFRTAWIRDADGRIVELREPTTGRPGEAS
jgi:catechol 2,3-dioxygenase-like lactoylglutathione lyase family enzyme